MSIKQAAVFKVYEQADDGSGCGTVVASRKCLADAEGARDVLARENPGTRFYVLAMVSASYLPTTGRNKGTLQTKAFTA
jgi:hypothetical protein